MESFGAGAGRVKIFWVACVQMFAVLLLWLRYAGLGVLHSAVQVVRKDHERQNVKSYINIHFP